MTEATEPAPSPVADVLTEDQVLEADRSAQPEAEADNQAADGPAIAEDTSDAEDAVILEGRPEPSEQADQSGFDAGADRLAEMFALLARSGAAEVALTLSPAVSEASEADALSALSPLVEGPIFRLAAWRYACRPAVDPAGEDLKTRFETELRAVGIGDVTVMPAPDQTRAQIPSREDVSNDEGPSRETAPAEIEARAITLIDAMARAVDLEPGQRAVIDAAFALQAVSLTASGIAEHIAEIPTPAAPSAPDLAPLSAEIEALGARIESLIRSSAQPAPAPQVPAGSMTEGTGLYQISHALETLIGKLETQSGELAATIGGLGTSAAKERFSEQLVQIGEALSRAEESQTERADALTAAIDRLAEASPAPAPDGQDAADPEALQKLSLALETTLRRLDRQCLALEAQTGRFAAADVSEAPEPAASGGDLEAALMRALAPVAERLAGIEAKQGEIERQLAAAPTAAKMDAPPQSNAGEAEIDRVLGDLASLRKDLRSLLTRYRNQFGRLEGMMDMLSAKGRDEQGLIEAMRGQIDGALAVMLDRLPGEADPDRAAADQA